MEIQYELQKTKNELKETISSRNMWKALFFCLVFVLVYNFFLPTNISSEVPYCEPTAYYPC